MAVSISEPNIGPFLFSGVDEAINSAFGVVNYRRKSAFTRVAERRAPSVDGVKLVDVVFRRIATNWDNGYRLRRPRSPCRLYDSGSLQ